MNTGIFGSNVQKLGLFILSVIPENALILNPELDTYLLEYKNEGL